MASGRTPVLELDENELITGLRSGDERALEALYHRHAGRVYALGLRLTADPSRAGRYIVGVGPSRSDT